MNLLMCFWEFCDFYVAICSAEVNVDSAMFSWWIMYFAGAFLATHYDQRVITEIDM